MDKQAATVWGRLIRGAAFECAYLDDLRTAATLQTGHTNPVDWFGLHSQTTANPSRPIQGLQIDGYFLDDDSQTTRAPGNSYGNKTYPHDSQFVIRLPSNWNGKLVVTGAPGVRGQYANDYIISDWVLDKGYAFACTDKGNSGLRFYCAGKTPGAAVVEWHGRVSQLTEAARDAAESYYDAAPARTYITGTSNGGYLTRYALEKHPDLYDGGVDWQGTVFRADGPNLLTYLPTALKHYPAYKASNSEAARDAIIAAGFEPASDFLWAFHYDNYWNATQRIYREEFDPYYMASDAEYDYTARIHGSGEPAQTIKNAVERVSLTGDVGKPLITLHGTLDALLPISKHSDVYAALVEKAGRSDRHRYYRIEGGTHIDSLYDYPDPRKPDRQHREKLRPILPCYRAAFEALAKWVEEGREPPGSQSVPKPPGGDALNRCPSLESQGA